VVTVPRRERRHGWHEVLRRGVLVTGSQLDVATEDGVTDDEAGHGTRDRVVWLRASRLGRGKHVHAVGSAGSQWSLWTCSRRARRAQSLVRRATGLQLSAARSLRRLDMGEHDVVQPQ
jgi:hypothetical protein